MMRTKVNVCGKIQETKSKAGPKNPTLPLHQTREGWGTQFRTFGTGWATRLCYWGGNGDC